MTLFWISATALIGLALLFVVPPLLSRNHRGRDNPDPDALALALFHRQVRELDADLAAGALDQQQYQTARQDLERALLHDVEGAPAGSTPEAGGGPWTAVLLAVLLPTAAVSLYLYLGNSEFIPRLAAATTTEAQTPAAHPGPPGELPSLEVMIQRLKDKLERHPDSLQDWMMLGHTYFAIGRPQRALPALERAYGLAPDNPDVLVAYAEAIAANHGSTLAGRPADLIRAAVKIDPKHTGARWLAGLVSFQATRYTQAAEQWEVLLATFDPESREAATLTRYIAQAHGRAGLEPKQSPAGAETRDIAQGTPPDTADAADPERPTVFQSATATGVTVQVSLAEPLWPQANVKDTLFIYAKAVTGPLMPLAVHRARVADLPLTVTLHDGMALNPAMKLSRFPAITVGARITKSDHATPRSGDLEGEVRAVKSDQVGIVQILIDRVRL